MSYIVMTSSCNSPAGKRWRNYYNIALVELEDGFKGRPKMISERARGVKRIVDYRHSVHIGETKRSAGYRLMDSFLERATALNGGEVPPLL